MKEYKDHNGDPFFVDDEFFADHEAYIHHLVNDYFLEEKDVDEGWQEIATIAVKEKMFEINESGLIDWLFDGNEDRWPEHGDLIEEDLRMQIRKHFDIKSFNAAIPELWYGTHEKMVIRKSDIIDDLRQELG